jgi:hypothetical protein
VRPEGLGQFKNSPHRVSNPQIYFALSILLSPTPTKQCSSFILASSITIRKHESSRQSVKLHGRVDGKLAPVFAGSRFETSFHRHFHMPSTIFISQPITRHYTYSIDKISLRNVKCLTKYLRLIIYFINLFPYEFCEDDINA